MSTDFKLQLPPHVNLDHVTLSVAKFLGDSRLTKRSTNQAFNTAQPTSHQNRWYFEYPNAIANTNVIGLLSFQYNAFDIISKSMHIHTQNYEVDARVLGYKQLSARAEPVSVAAAQMLVAQFGGFLMTKDSLDDYDLVVADSEAKIPRSCYIDSEIDTNEGENRVFERITNLIDQTETISLKALRNAEALAAYSFYYDHEKVMLEHIEKEDIKKEQAALKQLVPQTLNPPSSLSFKI